MRKLLSQLWEDDGGFIISIELLFIAVILVIGIIAGMGNLRIAMIVGLTQLANAVMAIDPGFEISGVSGDSAGSEGSQATMRRLPPTLPSPRLSRNQGLFSKIRSTRPSSIPVCPIKRFPNQSVNGHSRPWNFSVRCLECPFVLPFSPDRGLFEALFAPPHFRTAAFGGIIHSSDTLSQALYLATRVKLP